MSETIKSLPPNPTWRKYYDLTVNCRLEEEYIPVGGGLFRKSSKWEAVVSKPYENISIYDIEAADEPVEGRATEETPEQAIYLAINQFMVRRQVADAAKAEGRR